MYCQACGHEQAATVNFCKRCGVRINQSQTENQPEPVNNIHIDVTRPFKSLAALGIGGLFILMVMYKSLYRAGARDGELMMPFFFGTVILIVVAIVMGLLFNRVIGIKAKEQKNLSPQTPVPQVSRATGQIYNPQLEDSYRSGASVVDDTTRKMPERTF